MTGKFLGKGAYEIGIPTVVIALHGGEPLMLGKRRFIEICDALYEEITPYAALKLGVQTNGMLLDREWVELLASRRCAIGLSIDGPRHVHDSMRVDKQGRGTFDQTMAALSLLRDCASDGIIPDVGVLSVISRRLSAREAYDFFVKDQGIRRIFFKPPNLNWESFDQAEIDHVSAFLKEIFTIWLEEDDPSVVIRPNIEVFRPLLHDDTAKTRVTQIIDLAQAICIRSNGDVCPDDSLPPISPRYRDLGMNVSKDSLADFYASGIWPEIRASLIDPRTECAECRWFGMCGGGPTATRYSERELFARPSIYCDAYQWLFLHAAEQMKGALGEEDLARRIKLASASLIGAPVRKGAFA